MRRSLCFTLISAIIHGMDVRNRIRTGLSSLRLRTFDAGSDREAAVLVPVFERAGEPYFLLTRRTEDVQTHKGQISFPGGMREPGEALDATALRETWEEIGIQSSSVELLGRFHDYRSTTGYLVTPFAGYLAEPFETIPEVREVAEILLVPFRVFLDPARVRVEQMRRVGRMMEVYFYS
jgi:8-oxo-dGTP pyrophosphatase MutT (NUDIX family)